MIEFSEKCAVDIWLGLQLDGSRKYENIEDELPGRGMLSTYASPKMLPLTDVVLQRLWWPNVVKMIAIYVSVLIRFITTIISK